LGIQRKLAWFTGALVVVGFLQFFALVGQVTIYCRQAKIMTRQAHEMKRQRGYMRLQWKAVGEQARLMTRQLTEMGEQTGVLKASVAIAEKSADAAKDSVEMFISKERARLRIDMIDNFDPLSDTILGTEVSSVPYRVRLHGPTDAFIVDAGISAYLADSRDARPPLVAPMPIPRVLTVAVRDFTGSIPIFPHAKLKEKEVEDVAWGRRFLCFAGFIKYRDVFDRDRETRCRYFWNPPSPFTDGHWIQSSEQDNTQT